MTTTRLTLHQSPNLSQGDTRTMKIYTIAQRIDSVIDAALYVHAFGDAAFTKNSKCTTAKREIDVDHNIIDLVVYSYRVDGAESIAPGTKVYTIQQVTNLNDGTKAYSNFGTDEGFLNKNRALRHLKALRVANPGVRLALYSFKVDAPQPREFMVTLTVPITATSQEEADAIARRAYGVEA